MWDLNSPDHWTTTEVPTPLSLLLFVYLFIFSCVGSLLLHVAFSSCGEWGLLSIAVRGLLTAVASLVAEHGL